MTFIFVLALSALPSIAYAQVSAIATSITASAEDLPGLVSAFAYLLGLLFGVRGVLKLRAHVENPGNGSGQTPLRTPIVSFIVGGALFALPMLLSAAQNTIDGGATGGFLGILGSLFTGITAFSSGFSLGFGSNFNQILDAITVSLLTVPGLISAASYLLGLVLVVMGAIKVKEHVETPEQVKVSEAVIRLLAGGALLTMPVIYDAMYTTIEGTGGIFGVFAMFTGPFTSDFIGANCTVGTTGLGQRICGIVTHTGAFPAFLTAIAYIFGLVMGVWGILKIRDHVLNPQQTGVFEGISRLIAGGAFFALPFVVQVFTNSVVGTGITGSAFTSYNHGNATINGYVTSLLTSGSCPTGVGLDAMMLCLASDILGPIHVVLNFFAFVAGIIFIMIGISRLIKGAQEGAKAPGGLGTLMTFAIGGALISYNDIIRAATTTFTGSSTTFTNAKMQYTTGMSADETAAAHAVITAVIKFMIVIGIISFVRGLFIVRSVAEGNQQASMMAGVTHLIGGALAVNLGPVLNAVQETLGTTGFGVTFT
ncbi:MAG: hypothetical protein AB8B83_01525 [Bdellovibrionales bacterium]